ncbi:MAG: galactose-1-phosphate uridylyltransferase, partial [Chitinivibrionales bacterium]|nr:galactose-1-phosphate uridylyltransferase [Chitinivibrionales bacterium]
MNLSDHPHRRFNPLTGEWLLVSPHRAKRPWQGKVEDAQKADMPAYDPKCYLCPGNERAGGARNPAYEGVYVFDNDFAALLADVPSGGIDEKGLLVANAERGLCRVICFSPRHDLTLALMSREENERVVDMWAQQYREIGDKDFINYVQIFENRGAVMGCSNPHPHGQIWANETVPVLPAAESHQQKDYHKKNGSCLLCDYLQLEIEREERIVFVNDSFAALVPFWAVWPFEVMLLPRFHAGDITQCSTQQRADLADALRRMGIRFDNLFQTSFPYSMGIHQRPTDGLPHDEWHFHI